MEHALLIQSAYLLNLLFMGGTSLLGFAGSTILIVKVQITLTILIIIRAILPRYRYDQLIEIGWKTLLPVSLAGLIFLTASGYDSITELVMGLIVIKKTKNKSVISDTPKTVQNKKMNIYTYNHPPTPFFREIKMIGEPEGYMDGSILLSISEKGETPIFLSYTEKLTIKTRPTKQVEKSQLISFTYKELVEDWRESNYMLYEFLDPKEDLTVYERWKRRYQLPAPSQWLELNIGFAIFDEKFQVKMLSQVLFEISHDKRWESSGTRLLKELHGVAVLGRHSDSYFWMVLGYIVDGPNGLYYVSEWTKTSADTTDKNETRKTSLFRIMQRIVKGQTSIFMNNFDVLVERDEAVPL